MEASRCAHPQEAYKDERYRSFDSFCPVCKLEVEPSWSAAEAPVSKSVDLGAILDPAITSECKLIRVGKSKTGLQPLGPQKDGASECNGRDQCHNAGCSFPHFKPASTRRGHDAARYQVNIAA